MLRREHGNFVNLFHSTSLSQHEVTPAQLKAPRAWTGRCTAALQQPPPPPPAMDLSTPLLSSHGPRACISQQRAETGNSEHVYCPAHSSHESHQQRDRSGYGSAGTCKIALQIPKMNLQ